MCCPIVSESERIQESVRICVLCYYFSRVSYRRIPIEGIVGECLDVSIWVSERGEIVIRIVGIAYSARCTRESLYFTCEMRE